MNLGQLDIVSIMHRIAIAVIPLIFAITFHEAAHGWVAHKFGDSTAYNLGRVSANPLKHIDLVGTIIVPMVMLIFSGFIFGWAKPVPVQWNNLRNPRRDMALVALAGPFANLIMAVCWALIAKLVLMYLATTPQGSHHLFLDSVYFSALFGITINCVLFVLNLLPIPPLDGSRVISSFLSNKAAYLYAKIEPYGFLILLALLFLGILRTILWPPVMGLVGFLRHSFHLFI